MRSRVIELARELARARWARLLGRVAAAALVLVLALRLVQLWRRHPVDFSHADWRLLAPAVLASIVAVASYGLVWPCILRRLGTPAPFSWITLFFKSQLGKYLPGSVWQYAGRVGLARARGVPTSIAVGSLVVEVAASAAAAGAVGLLVLPLWLTALLWLALAVALTSLALVARRLPRPRLLPNVAGGLRAMPMAGGLYVLVWGAYGVAFWLTGRALFAVPAAKIPFYIGVFALGWLAGLVALFAPGGVGVREAVIVALLGGRIGQAHAIVLAGASRLFLTAVDLAAGAVSLSLPLFRRPPDQPFSVRPSEER